MAIKKIFDKDGFSYLSESEYYFNGNYFITENEEKKITFDNYVELIHKDLPDSILKLRKERDLLLETAAGVKSTIPTIDILDKNGMECFFNTRKKNVENLSTGNDASGPYEKLLNRPKIPLKYISQIHIDFFMNKDFYDSLNQTMKAHIYDMNGNSIKTINLTKSDRYYDGNKYYVYCNFYPETDNKINLNDNFMDIFDNANNETNYHLFFSTEDEISLFFETFNLLGTEHGNNLENVIKDLSMTTVSGVPALLFEFNFKPSETSLYGLFKDKITEMNINVYIKESNFTNIFSTLYSEKCSIKQPFHKSQNPEYSFNTSKYCYNINSNSGGKPTDEDKKNMSYADFQKINAKLPLWGKNDLNIHSFSGIFNANEELNSNTANHKNDISNKLVPYSLESPRLIPNIKEEGSYTSADLPFNAIFKEDCKGTSKIIYFLYDIYNKTLFKADDEEYHIRTPLIRGKKIFFAISTDGSETEAGSAAIFMLDAFKFSDEEYGETVKIYDDKTIRFCIIKNGENIGLFFKNSKDENQNIFSINNSETGYEPSFVDIIFDDNSIENISKNTPYLNPIEIDTIIQNVYSYNNDNLLSQDITITDKIPDNSVFIIGDISNNNLEMHTIVETDTAENNTKKNFLSPSYGMSSSGEAVRNRDSNIYSGFKLISSSYEKNNYNKVIFQDTNNYGSDKYEIKILNKDDISLENVNLIRPFQYTYDKSKITRHYPKTNSITSTTVRSELFEKSNDTYILLGGSNKFYYNYYLEKFISVNDPSSQFVPATDGSERHTIISNSKKYTDASWNDIGKYFLNAPRSKVKNIGSLTQFDSNSAQYYPAPVVKVSIDGKVGVYCCFEQSNATYTYKITKSNGSVITKNNIHYTNIETTINKDFEYGDTIEISYSLMGNPLNLRNLTSESGYNDLDAIYRGQITGKYYYSLIYGYFCAPLPGADKEKRELLITYDKTNPISGPFSFLGPLIENVINGACTLDLLRLRDASVTPAIEPKMPFTYYCHKNNLNSRETTTINGNNSGYLQDKLYNADIIYHHYYNNDYNSFNYQVPKFKVSANGYTQYYDLNKYFSNGCYYYSPAGDLNFYLIKSIDDCQQYYIQNESKYHFRITNEERYIDILTLDDGSTYSITGVSPNNLPYFMWDSGDDLSNLNFSCLKIEYRRVNEPSKIFYPSALYLSENALQELINEKDNSTVDKLLENIISIKKNMTLTNNEKLYEIIPGANFNNLKGNLFVSESNSETTEEINRFYSSPGHAGVVIFDME